MHTTLNEPIIAWRVWRIEDEQLISMFANSRWPFGIPLQSEERPTIHKWKYVGFENIIVANPTGVHAFKDLRDAKSYSLLSYDNLCIIGEVYLWGTIIEHEKGYRAEFAYPKSLKILQLPICKESEFKALENALRNNYGCEVEDFKFIRKQYIKAFFSYEVPAYPTLNISSLDEIPIEPLYGEIKEHIREVMIYGKPEPLIINITTT